MLKTRHEVEIETTPEELGKLFAAMNDDEQARFFIAAGNEAATWKEGCWGMQFIRAGEKLRGRDEPTERARDILLYCLMGLFPKAMSFRDGTQRFEV